METAGLEARFLALESAVAAATQRAAAAEDRARIAEDRLGAAMDREGAGSPTRLQDGAVGGRPPPRMIVDTRLLAKPAKFRGQEQDWASWSFTFRSYVGAVDADLRRLMDAALVEEDVNALRNASQADRHEALSRPLYYILVMLVEGQALAKLQHCGDGEGFAGWRALVEMYEPATAGRFAGLLQQLIAGLRPDHGVSMTHRAQGG